MTFFITAIITIFAVFCIAFAFKKARYSSSLLLKLLRKYHYLIENEAEQKPSVLWGQLAKEYFDRRGWKEENSLEMQNLLAKSYEDYASREDIILSEKESARELLRRLLLCEKAFNRNVPLQLEETEEIYRKVENLVRKVF